MTVRLAMNYTDAATDDIDRWILDDEVVFEQKFDGTCVLAVIEYGKPVRFLQRSGRVLTHTAVTQHLSGIRSVLEAAFVGDTPGEVVVVGELMVHTGEYHLFDVPYVRFGGVEVISPTDPYYKRRAVLRSSYLVQALHGTKVRISQMAESKHEKKRLLDAVREAGGEGVMAKNILHPYEPGKRSKQAVKLKFVKTADVVVTAVDRPDAKHGNFKLGAYKTTVGEPGTAMFDNVLIEMVDVGGASAIGKDKSIEVGDVVEVNYLYWTGTNLYQPRVMRKRTDKAAHECTIDQFPVYSRATIDLNRT